MKAILREQYGDLRLGELEKPSVGEREILVRVRASSVNPLDWYDLTGRPMFSRVLGGGVRRPKDPRVGCDFAGTVETVGGEVERFRPGDEVFGVKAGSFAEYVCVAEDGPVARKPTSVGLEEAAAIGAAGLTALQALRDKGVLQAGQKVLVNGASGGVGTFAVQIARDMGGEVTGVCSSRNVELVRALGAAHVVDYTRDDFTRGGERFDLMLDVVGSRSWSACKRVLADDATVVLIGGPKRNRVLGPVGHMAGMLLASKLSSRKAVFFIAKPNQADLAALAELVDAGSVRPVVDRRYELGELPDAMAYLGDGHARGKVVITVPS